MRWKSAVLVSLTVLSVLSCSNDGQNPVDPAKPFPYTTPSVTSVQPNLSDLQQKSGGDPSFCHALSTVAVGWVNLNVAVRLAVPIAAFGACLNTQPVYLGELTWRWTANGGLGINAWTAELTGHDAGGGRVDWAMRVSGTQLTLNRFLWFDGQCDTAAHAGVWHYYDPTSLSAGVEVVRCTWSLPASASAPKSIVFENMTVGEPASGDRLRYALADSIASVGFDDANPVGTTQIRWDLRNGAGKTVAANGDSCCWGARPLFSDTNCP
jgi:hypothetical protein